MNNNEIVIKYLKNLITRILLSVSIVLIIGIFIKLNINNKKIIEKYIFSDSFKFTEFNTWYKNNLGNIIPTVKNNEIMVFNSDDILKLEHEKYNDGVKIKIDKNSPISLLSSGLVVFIGNKDNYGNTLIIQGNDGINYWYSNIQNINVNLYDYLEKNTLIGESKDDFIYLVLEKDGVYLKYDEVFK